MKRLLSAVFLLGLASLVGLLTIVPLLKGKTRSEAPASVGDEDDLEARERFEWMRLRDPKTGRIPDRIRQSELTFARRLPTRENLRGIYPQQTVNWTQRGPWNVMGRTRAIGIDIRNDNTILSGGASGGMWRTTDGGRNWTRTTALAQLPSVTCIAQDLRNGKPDIWYYGTGERTGNSADGGGGATYLGDGVYKSTDGGLSWALLPSTTTGTPQTFSNRFQFVWNIATDPSNATQDVVYAATIDAIQRSTDGGTSWQVVLGGSTGSSQSEFTDVAITSTGVVYATLSSDGTTRGIFRSADGVTWANIAPPDFPANVRRNVIGIAPSSENTVYFLAQTPGSGTGSGEKSHSLWQYTYVSGDGTADGGRWENRSAQIPMFGGQVGNFDSQGSYDLVIRVKPNNPDVVFIGGTNLYRSTDGFRTTANSAWIGGYATTNDVSQYLNSHPDHHVITFLPSNPNSNIMFAGHDNGISRTEDCLATTINWTQPNTGYLNSQFYAVAVDQATNGDNTIVGGLQDNGTFFINSANTTDSWGTIDSGDGGFCAIANGRGQYYTSSQNGTTTRLILTPNGVQQEFTRVDPARPNGAVPYLFINPFTLDPNDSKVMYFAGGDRIWRNSDLTQIAPFSNNPTSTNWVELTNTALPPNSIVTTLSPSRTPANQLYYGTDQGKIFRLDDATTPATPPVEVTGANFPQNAFVSCIAVDPTNSSRALAVFSNYSVVSLFLTENAGASWTAVAGNLEQNPDGSGNGPSCRWAAITQTQGGPMYFVGTSTGLYSTSSLNGQSTNWAQEGASIIGNVVVNMVLARQADGLIVAATHGNGVFSTTLGGGGGGGDTQPPTVRLAAPLGGEKLRVDRLFTIAWQSSDNVGVDTQDILLSGDGGASYPVTLATGLSGSAQSFDFTPTEDVRTKKGRVRIVARDKAGNVGQDESPGNFKIK